MNKADDMAGRAAKFLDLWQRNLAAWAMQKAGEESVAAKAGPSGTQSDDRE